jgi:hypothetical protein
METRSLHPAAEELAMAVRQRINWRDLDTARDHIVAFYKTINDAVDDGTFSPEVIDSAWDQLMGAVEQLDLPWQYLDTVRRYRDVIGRGDDTAASIIIAMRPQNMYARLGYSQEEIDKFLAEAAKMY